MKSKVVETRAAKLWLSEDGIVMVIFKPNIDVTLADMEEILDTGIKLRQGRKAPVFSDIRELKSMTREARQIPSHDVSVGATHAVAALIGSPVSRVLGNFFLGFNKPPYPLKLFTSEEKALAWLRSFLD